MSQGSPPRMKIAGLFLGEYRLAGSYPMEVVAVKTNISRRLLLRRCYRSRRIASGRCGGVVDGQPWSVNTGVRVGGAVCRTALRVWIDCLRQAGVSTHAVVPVVELMADSWVRSHGL